MSNTRYYVFSKRVGPQKVLKNAATREDARDYKRSQSNPANYGIVDRFTGQTIR